MIEKVSVCCPILPSTCIFGLSFRPPIPSETEISACSVQRNRCSHRLGRRQRAIARHWFTDRDLQSLPFPEELSAALARTMLLNLQILRDILGWPAVGVREQLVERDCSEET